ncbi:hypothetical protein BH11PSE11_BH11PSE11_13940 [soil metagenome]
MRLARDEQDFSIYKEICKGFELLHILDLLGTQLEGIPSIDDYVINLLDERRENLLSLKLRFAGAEFKPLEKAYFKYKYPLDDESNINARAFNQGQRCKIDSETGSPDEQRIQRLWKVEQIVSIPFRSSQADHELIGTILVTKKNGHVPPEAYVAIQEIIDTFIAPVTTALGYFYLSDKKEEFENTGEGQRRFLEFICELSNLTDLEEIFSLFSNELAHRFPFEAFTYFLHENDYLVGKNVTITSEKYNDYAEDWASSVIDVKYVAHNPVNPVSHAFILNRHLLFEDAQKIIDIAENQKAGALGELAANASGSAGKAIRALERTLLYVPIRHRNDPIGVCVLHSLSSTVNVNAKDLRLVEQLCMFLGAEISNARNFMIQQEQHKEIARLNFLLQGQVTELSEQASTDQLTGLYNFRTFKSEIKRRLLISQKASGESSLSIAVVDIDHFKKFNDTYGHAAGNVVLAGTAGEINKLVRKFDLACRYGGEEFVVLLDNCGTDGVRIFAERMRSAIETAQFDVEGATLKVTASVGCATSTLDDTPESLFERADAALYDAKHAGRNRVEVK